MIEATTVGFDDFAGGETNLKRNRKILRLSQTTTDT